MLKKAKSILNSTKPSWKIVIEIGFLKSKDFSRKIKMFW
jgi:hypothetical protein